MDQWHFVMQTNDQERIDKVVQFAQETLPLKEIASGPADSLGLGPEFQHHRALDFVLQELRRFPGKGWPLIRASPSNADRPAQCGLAVCYLDGIGTKSNLVKGIEWMRKAARKGDAKAQFNLGKSLSRRRRSSQKYALGTTLAW